MERKVSQRSREKQSAYWHHLGYLLAQRKKRWEIKRELAYLRLQLELPPQSRNSHEFLNRGVSGK